MIAIIIFGAANAVTRKLTDIGGENLIDGRNPISFCNVLFVGNLCALILLIIIYQGQWRKDLLTHINTKQWLNMSLVAILGAAIVPTLIFTALSITAVNNVVLIGQIDTPLTLALSVCLLGERVNKWIITGAIVAFIGVSLTVLLQIPDDDTITVMGGQVGWGELLTLLAAILKAVANLISKVSLKEIPLGIFSVYRMLTGTIFFFIVVLILFEPSHFIDVTAPFLWRWMLIYSAVIVVVGQLAWFKGLKLSTASEVSLATAFNPIVGVLAAFFILGEVPTLAQYFGGAIILAGIFLNQMGLIRRRKQEVIQSILPNDKEMNEAITFKGI
jgi:drug/metabolite transporter (DMT)-like permease